MAKKSEEKAPKLEAKGTKQDEKEAKQAPQEAPDYKNIKDEASFITTVEAYLLSFAAKVPSKRPALWVRTLFHPREVIEETEDASLLSGAKNIVATTLPILVVAVAMTPMLLGVGIILTVAYLILSPFWIPVLVGFSIISWFLSSALMYLIAKILGGSGEFKRFAYKTSLARAAADVLSATLYVPSAVPILGYCFLIFLRFIQIVAAPLTYSYIDYLSLRKEMGLSFKRALGVVIAARVIETAVVISLVVVFYFIYFTMILGPMMAATALAKH